MSRRTVPILPFLLLVLVCGPAGSQATSVDEDSLRSRLPEALGLTLAQRDSLRFLRSDLAAELALLRSQVAAGELLPIEGRLRYRELLDGYRVAQDGILTDGQRALLARALQLARARRLADGLPPPPPPLQQLPEALDLTSEQITRWRALLARQRQEVQQMRAEGQILQPADYRRLREAHRIAFESLLTAEQRLRLEQVRHRWRSARLLPEVRPDSLATGDDLPFPDDLGGFDDQEPLPSLPE